MRRGDICLVELEPTVGAEANKRRPAVVVSHDRANLAASSRGRGVITVVPLTSNVERVHRFQVLLRAADTGLPRDSKAQAEQVRSIDVSRVGPALARLRPSDLGALDDALRLHLQL